MTYLFPLDNGLTVSETLDNVDVTMTNFTIPPRGTMMVLIHIQRETPLTYAILESRTDLPTKEQCLSSNLTIPNTTEASYTRLITNSLDSNVTVFVCVGVKRTLQNIQLLESEFAEARANARRRRRGLNGYTAETGLLYNVTLQANVFALQCLYWQDADDDWGSTGCWVSLVFAIM